LGGGGGGRSVEVWLTQSTHMSTVFRRRCLHLWMAANPSNPMMKPSNLPYVLLRCRSQAAWWPNGTKA